MMGDDERPDIQYSDIGGMDIQKQEMREAVELPLTHFELYRQVRAGLVSAGLACGGLGSRGRSAVPAHLTRQTLRAALGRLRPPQTDWD